VNITLSADPELIRRAREYAKEHGTTLNQLVREHLRWLCGEADRKAAAEEFLRICLEHPGRSEPGYKFDRDGIHDRSQA